jgi:hypothetical protein
MASCVQSVGSPSVFAYELIPESIRAALAKCQANGALSARDPQCAEAALAAVEAIKQIDAVVIVRRRKPNERHDRPF